MAIDYVGILGRPGSRLGRHVLGRIPSSNPPAEPPCPYIPSRLGDATQSSSAPRASISADAHAYRSAAVLSGMPTRVAPNDTAPVRQNTDDSHAARPRASVETPGRAASNDDAHAQRPAEATSGPGKPGGTAETAANKPRATDAATAPQKPLPASDQIPIRKPECR